MTHSRRQFIVQGSALGAAAGFGLAGPATRASAAGGRGLVKDRPMKATCSSGNQGHPGPGNQGHVEAA